MEMGLHIHIRKCHTGKQKNNFLTPFDSTKGNTAMQYSVLSVLCYTQKKVETLVLNLCLYSDQLSVNIEQIQIVFWEGGSPFLSDFFKINE